VKARERGTATVEAAIALPLLLFLMVAAVEIGRAFIQYTVLADSSRNAIRHVAEVAMQARQRVTITPAVITQTRNLVVYGNETGTGTAILPGLTASQVTIADAGNNNVRVSVVYPYQPLFGAALPRFGATQTSITSAFNMNIVVTMRAL
jgi:hypothetical protein